MTRNYKIPRVDPQWAASRETHIAVATAIHALADSARTPDAIWESPTPAEWEHVTMAVAEYVLHGDCRMEPDGRYPWGQESIIPAVTERDEAAPR